MTDKPRPLTAAEKKTAKQAHDAILAAVDGKTGLTRLVESAFKQCSKDFQSADIGRWHVIDAFVKGHRGDIQLSHLYRHYDGFIQAVVAGAGLSDERPDFSMAEIYELAAKVDEQRRDWRARA